MIWKRFFDRSEREQEPYAIYGALVSQARSPALYLHAGVPDTLEGRFEMVLLHTFLVLRRLRLVEEPHVEEAKALSQRVFEVFFDDMDQTLREIGISDLKVGKEIKGMAASFYGRIEAYDKGLDAEDEAVLKAALRRNVYPREPAPTDEDLNELTAYVRRAEAALAACPIETLLAGEIAVATLPQPHGASV